jgi:hypothetical protein
MLYCKIIRIVVKLKVPSHLVLGPLVVRILTLNYSLTKHHVASI